VLYRISDGSVTEVESTTVLNEDLYEKDLEDWVEKRPDILGEPLLVIGRQVQLNESKDRIDLLALDKDANLVIIELKRDLVGGSADLQALRYAALVSRWTFEVVRQQAEGYWKTTGSGRGTLAQEIEGFCEEGYELNADQRIILAGRDLKPLLGSMALWLRGHSVDVKVVAVNVLKDAERLYVQPQAIIPVPSEDKIQVSVSAGSSDKPWLSDGQRWHLEQRCSPKGREIVEALVELVGRAAPDAEGPNWNQKFYVSWRIGSNLWAWLNTRANQGTLNVLGFSLSAEDAAERLGFAVFDTHADLSDKLKLGSSVAATDDPNRLNFIVKSTADISGDHADMLVKLLEQAWHGFADSDGSGQASRPGAVPALGEDVYLPLAATEPR
jgi:hypothetical protein